MDTRVPQKSAGAARQRSGLCQHHMMRASGRRKRGDAGFNHHFRAVTTIAYSRRS